MIGRMLRACRLDSSVFELVENDPSYSAEARRVVLVVAVIAATGAGLHSLSIGVEAALVAFLGRGLFVWFGWVAWAAISEWLGTTLTAGEETHSDMGEAFRVLAYAQTPWILGAFVFLPRVGWALFLLAGLWVLAAGTVAIRQALDFSTSRAVLTVIIGWVVMLAVFIVLTLLAMIVRAALGGMIS